MTSKDTHSRITDENIDKYYKEKLIRNNIKWIIIISDSDLEKSMVNSGEFVIVNKHLQHVNVYQKLSKELNK